MLLRRGASVDLQCDTFGGTALMCAAINGHTTIVQALLDAKADTSLHNIDGRTALMLAEQEKQTATAQLLRQHAKQQAAERKTKVAEVAEPGTKDGSSAGGSSAAAGSSAGSSSSAGTTAPLAIAPKPGQPPWIRYWQQRRAQLENPNSNPTP